jgi:hypothetical protein
MKKSLILVSLAVCAVVALITLQSNDVSAQASSRPVTGYAWSSTIGWISLSNTTDGSSIPYGVTADTAGNLTGQAWSDNVGWIKFGGFNTGSMPVGGAPQLNAYINNAGTPTNYNDDYVDGWVRVCSIYVSGSCPGAIAPSNISGGWDGWISLSGNLGDSEEYKAKVNTNLIVGENDADSQSWGDAVLGWLGFEINVDAPPAKPACDDDEDNDDDGFIDYPADPGCEDPTDDNETNLPPVVDPGTLPTISLKVGLYTPNLKSFVAPRGTESVKLGWTVANATACTSSTVPSSAASWNGLIAPSNGTAQPLINSTNPITVTFILTCTNGASTPVTDEVRVTFTGQKEQ